MINSEQKYIFMTGLFFLLFGLLIYTFFRSIDNLYIFNSLSNYAFVHIKIPYADNLPSFLHVVSFSLITISISGLSRKSIILSCSSWVCINFIFEYFQGTSYSMKTFMDEDVLKAFCQNGTFNFYDIVFSFLGGFFAALIANIFLIKRR